MIREIAIGIWCTSALHLKAAFGKDVANLHFVDLHKKFPVGNFCVEHDFRQQMSEVERNDAVGHFVALFPSMSKQQVFLFGSVGRHGVNDMAL